MSKADITIYHNPRCSKSRTALQTVRDAGVEPTVVEYIQHPPSADQLDAILKMLAMEPRDLMRKGEKEYKSLGLDDAALDRRTLIRAMVEHPVLIERPIIVKGNRAVVGRPPERVRELL